jgi:hypothetical protein
VVQIVNEFSPGPFSKPRDTSSSFLSDMRDRGSALILAFAKVMEIALEKGTCCNQEPVRHHLQFVELPVGLTRVSPSFVEIRANDSIVALSSSSSSSPLNLWISW